MRRETRKYKIWEIYATLELRKTHFLQDKNELVVIKKGANILVDKDSVFRIQDRLILKGNNSANKWTKKTGVNDAFAEIISTLINWKGALPSNPIEELETRITNFEALIDLSKIKEDSLQTFFEKQKEFLQMGCTYKKLYPHIKLPREEGDLIPDFFLERVTDGFCDILDIKLPDKSLIVGGYNRRKFSVHVESAIAQVHEYSEVFDDREKRKHIEEEYGLKVYKPKILILIGVDVSPEDRRKIINRFSGQIEIITYDHILSYIKQLLDTVKQYHTVNQEIKKI